MLSVRRPACSDHSWAATLHPESFPSRPSCRSERSVYVAAPARKPEPLCFVPHLTASSDQCHTGGGLRHRIITAGWIIISEEKVVAKGRVSIVVERCKSCGFCVEFCPTKVLALSSAFNSRGYHPPHVVHPEKCSGCDLCGMYCPDFAIYATKLVQTAGAAQ